MNVTFLAPLFIGVFCVLSGLFFILQAIWTLRTGQNEARFLSRGMIGLILLILPWFLIPVLGMMGTTSIHHLQ